MLEGPLKSWIVYFLGQYVESQTVNVSAKLWKASERLKLENLTLKESIIPSWLPFRLKAGFIGQFEADLPISAIFGSSSAKIKFIDVLIVLSPLNHDATEIQDEVAHLVADKMQRLEKDLLDRWNGPQVPEYMVSRESEGYFGTDGWLGRTISKLIDNLQIDIRNLHIRIEGVWHPSSPPRSAASNTGAGAGMHPPPSNKSYLHPDHSVKYAVGITLGALSAVTTPRNWRIDGFDKVSDSSSATDKPQADGTTEKSHLVFKLINALDLSAYVDPVALHFIHSRVHPRVLQSALVRLKDMGAKRNARVDWWNAEESVHAHRFLVAPIEISLKLTMNTATQHAQTGDPRYDAEFHLSRISMTLDEEQWSVLGLIIDSYSAHDQWRVTVAEQQKLMERTAASDAEKMSKVAEDYLLCWKQIISTKKDNLDGLKKSYAWQQATAIERLYPFEMIVSLRNQAGLTDITGTIVPFASMLHVMGDAMGVPLPEISVAFAQGPTGLSFELTPERDIAVKQIAEKSPAASKASLKPGLLLVKVDGKDLYAVLHARSGVDVQLEIDSMPNAKVLTFRHPSVKAPEVTPSHLVSHISFSSDRLRFQLVRASKQQVLAEVTMDHPVVLINGFGPNLFSYHLYQVTVTDYYIQNVAFDDGTGSYCIASSVCKPIGVYYEEDEPPPALFFEMNYLHDSHPNAVLGDVNSYGSKISFSVGDSIFVFDEEKMTELLAEWHEFFSAISTQQMRTQPPPTYLSQPLTSTSTSTPSTAASTVNISQSEDLLFPTSSTSYSYEVKVDRLRLFISAKRSIPVPPELPQQRSYRALLKQLVTNETSVAPIAPDWAKATRAIVVMQRFIRGAIVRKRKMVRLALTKSRWIYYQGDEMMGWLYTRDDTLAFRRWRRSWCHLDDDCIFSVYSNGSGADLLDEFNLFGCNVILTPNVRGGPWGSYSNKPVGLLEITTATRTLRMVLSSDDIDELERWKRCIENSARRATRQDMEFHKDYDQETTLNNDHSKNYRNMWYDDDEGNLFRRFGSQTGSISEHLLFGGFSDSYRSASSLQLEKSSWISCSITDFEFYTDVHSVSEPEQSAFTLYIGVKYLSVRDHRKISNHGLLHLGDKFLTLKNGVLTPGKLRCDQLQKGPSLALNASCRGARAPSTCFVLKNGLQIDLDVTGWVMPLNLTGLIYEIINVLDVLWTDPSISTIPNVHDQDRVVGSTGQEVSPWYKVTELGIQIRAPILEAYVEETHCVAKLSIEKNTIVYRADAGMENMKIHLGPTALFVLTEEVALRLAQIDKFWFNYDLRVHKFTDSTNRCNLCADESSKRATCHRSISASFGQVKLEADRRLELLFALLEALAVNEEPKDDTQDSTAGNEYRSADEEKDDCINHFQRGYDVNSFVGEFSRTQRMQSMQFSLSDPEFNDLRPMYSGFGRSYASPTGHSRISTVTSAGNIFQQEYDQAHPKPRSKISTLIPLLNYQSFITILGDPTTKQRTLFRIRLRVGRVHDQICVSCSSVVFEVIKRSLSVVALDTYIPVMNLSVSDMKLQSYTRTEFSLDYILDASVEISARYYNTTLADWEPFIEPWRCYAKIRNEIGTSGMSMQISAMQRLNINFTDAFVRLLSSVIRNRRRQVFYVEKRTPAAVAADGEAKKEDGRVCVLNNLGVPIRLANLNTSRAGTLHVEVRDGWTFPGYARFHDVRVQVVLLPWWYPREAQTLENLRHKFSLPYGGAQSGVTPILRIDVSSTDRGKRNFVFDHVTNKYVEVDDDDDDLDDFSPLTSQSSANRMTRADSSGSTQTKWYSIGTAEINLAGSVMGLDLHATKLNRWYRIHDSRGNITGEIFVGLNFVPHAVDAAEDKVNEPDQVKDGQFLVFDPLKIITTKKSRPKISSKQRSSKSLVSSKESVMLSNGLRGSYIPPLALEVMIGSKRCSLLCPLRRAGKFLIQGDNILAEVKVAQRDESRRVLLLSSPVQLKNDTSVDMELWTCRTNLDPGETGLLPKPDKSMLLTTSNKISVPLSAMFGESKQSLVVKVDGCKPTVVADLGKLAAGSSILALEPEPGHPSGYCFYVNIISQMRKVYREEQDIFTRGTTNSDGELQSYATKYHISLHSCLVFENTLPIRVQFKVVTTHHMTGSQVILRAGTLSPGDDVDIHEFEKNAQLFLRLPEMDSIWTRPISLADCIFREGMDKRIKSLLGASDRWDPMVEFLPTLQSSNVVFKDEDMESKRIIARLDYTSADDGSPRIVLYCTLWIYNQSHVQTLLFRSADEMNPQLLYAPQLVPERPVPRLMDCPNQAFEISTIIDHEVSHWSEKIHSTVVGIQAPINLRFGRKLGPKTKNEIGISIQRHLGQFHRTTQVVVTSRFVFVNKTNAPFKISHNARDNERVVELPPISKTGIASTSHFDFDVAGNVVSREVYIRMNHKGAEWSGPFSIADEKEFPLKLKGAVTKPWKASSSDGYEREGFKRCDVNMHRLKIRISNVGATIVVTLMKDDPPMYLICNESSVDLFVNQVKGSAETVVVRSMEFVPFAWVKPDGARRVACRAGLLGQNTFSSRRSRVYDFANLDREKGMGDLKFRLFGSKIQYLSADIIVDRSSRVLVFRNRSSEKPPCYILEVKIIAARLKNEMPLKQESMAEFVAEIDNDNELEKTTGLREPKTTHVYRFDSDLELASESRPRILTLKYFEYNRRQEVTRDPAASSIEIDDDELFDDEKLLTNLVPPGSPTAAEDSAPFEIMETPVASPSYRNQRSQESNSSLPRQPAFCHHDSDLSYLGNPLRLSGIERVSESYVSSLSDEDAENQNQDHRNPDGVVEIRIPRKAWTRFGVGMKRSVAWSYNNVEQARQSFGQMEGHWWEIRHPDTGDLVGEVQVALKFRTSIREHTHPTDIFNVSVTVPSIGISFLHNANSTMVEVAYLSMQRMVLLYSCAGDSSEMIFSLGNIQMDNQMDSEVVLGPKVHRVKEGVSVRLRDRWRSFMTYRYRGILEQFDSLSNLSVIQFRMLWNSNCNAGDITHYELIELIMQEIEISTDEKFVVNLISVFQGMEGLTNQTTFEEIVNTHVDYTSIGGSATSGASNVGASSSSTGVGASDDKSTTTVASDGIYIEELAIEALRITFSMELNGGRYIKTLGPSGRRLAVHLPESNVKDFHLYLTKLSFSHIYETKSSVIEKITRRYQQQAVILVLSGLHTVSVYANPFRIVYRLGHGFVELVRLPARGLASGSPIELITGAYLGVKSLAMNTISASYEIVAGTAGILGAVISPLVPESKRKAFEEDMLGFQRAVIEEVDAFDAAEERTMTKVIVRKPRVFDPAGVGLLTVYGPGSVPLEEQDRIDHKAVLVLQQWWRRRWRAQILYAEALRLRPDMADLETRHQACSIQ